MTFTVFTREYLRDLARLGGQARTVECYDLTYAQFISFLRSRNVNDDIRAFTPENIEGFRDQLLDGGCKASSVKTKLAGLSSLGKWGTQKKGPKGYLLDENPVMRVKRPKVLRVPEKYLTRDELDALLRVRKKPYEQLAVDLFLDTALRVSEAADALVRDLRLDGGRTVLTVRLKGGSTKDVQLGTSLAEKLERTLREREAGPDEPVLVNYCGKPFTRTSLGETIYRVARRAGIKRLKVRPHVLRKTVATLAHESGESLADVAAMLNHADVSTVQKYVFSTGVAAARDRVREALRGGL